jgi:hypothetical protein
MNLLNGQAKISNWFGLRSCGACAVAIIGELAAVN